MLEIKAHLLESLLGSNRAGEAERLADAIDRMGDPHDYVPGWVEERLQLAAESGTGIRSLYRLMRFNALKGVRHLMVSLLMGLCYMLVFYLFFMSLLKLTFPENIGFYTSAGGIPFLGFVDAQGFNEHLGWWLVPLGLVTSIALLFVLTRLINRFYARK